MKQDFWVEELKRQLEQAGAADPDRKLFGAEEHGYQWNPPASLEEVEDFEAETGVSLPEEYRRFLLEAGNGGAGPFYGLFPLKEVACRFSWKLELEKTPFLTPQTQEAPEDAEENWMRGCIPIGMQGDTYFTGLMVTGEYRGRVVYLEYEGSWIFFPREPDFLSWYQRWLREVCAHYESGWFGLWLDGDEQQLIEYYQQAESEEDRQEALLSMKKFPKVSETTVEFLKTALLERAGLEDIRAFLPLLEWVGPQFYVSFLEKRWDAGLYDAVVREVRAAVRKNEEQQKEWIEQWWSRILEKLPQLSPDTRLLAVSLLEKSKAVPLSKIRWVLQEETDRSRKVQLLEEFARFEDAPEQLDIWTDILLKERKDLKLLKDVFRTAPVVDCPGLWEAVLAVKQAFLHSKDVKSDSSSQEAWERTAYQREEQEVYRCACNVEKELWYEQINPKREGIPRPHRIKLNHCDEMNLAMNIDPPENGVAIHPMVALAIRKKINHLPRTVFGWEKALNGMKSLSLELNEQTVFYWERKDTAVLRAPDEFPPKKPFYYCMEKGWAIIGQMKRLNSLTISQICVEDFSFLPQCKNLEELCLRNTNFTDCRLLLELPKLKKVDLRDCVLEHPEALEKAAFEYCLK